jgi:hypothetical protein
VPMIRCMNRFLLALTSVALLLAACGEGGSSAAPSADPQTAVMSALAKTYEQRSMHVEFEMRMAVGTEDLSFTGSEDVDLKSGAARMTMDLGMLDGTMEVLTDGTIIYMRSPGLTQAFGVKTDWVSMDTEALAGAAGNPFGGLGTGQLDPSAFVGFFAGAVHVKRTGVERIDDATTTRYEGTIDLAKVLGGFAEVVGTDAGAEQVRRGLLQLKLMGLGDIPFTVWIDEEGLLRKERLTMDLGMIPGAPKETGMTIEATFSNYGAPVDVEPPRPSKVTDVTDMAKAA